MDRRWLPAIAGAAALGVAVLTSEGPGQRLDQALYRRFNRKGGAFAEAGFKGVTELGSIWASAGAAASLSAGGRRREAFDALAAAGTMWVVGQLAKKFVLRPRPYVALTDLRLLIDRPRGTSWPSSHPAVLTTFVTVAMRDLGTPGAVRAALATLVGAVGLSRVYLGVHYPSDVVGGLLLGRGVADLWTAWASPRILRRAPSLEVPGTVGA